MNNQSLIRFLSLSAVIILCSTAGCLLLTSDDSDAYSHGSSDSPLTSINFKFTDLSPSDLDPYYVKVGSSVSISGNWDADVESGLSVHVESVTSGYGLTREMEHLMAHSMAIAVLYPVRFPKPVQSLSV